MAFIDTIIEKAKKDIKTIILPEATDIRVLNAASKLQNQKIANIILLGNEEEISKIAKENNIDLSEIQIINPKTSETITKIVIAFALSSSITNISSSG